MSHVAQIIQADSDVPVIYQHLAKRVDFLEPLTPPGLVLKWYAVFPPDRAIPVEITNLARRHVATGYHEARGLGFAILHRRGGSFYFLIVCTWRGCNEVWETVFYKDGDSMDDFALFPRNGEHKPTFCVWELVPVWHEQQAWTRFLMSPRDEAAAQRWLQDCFSGLA